MRRLLLLLTCGLAAGLLRGEARQDGPGPQVTFRAGVDMVDVDVSVLDRNRLPLRGLTATDFTVYEDGQPRPIAAFSAVDLPSRERPSAPWMAEVAPDVLSNEFPREGRVIVILMDRSIGVEDRPSAVEFAEATVDQMRPGDLAAVAYSTLGVPQNFTADRARLLAAIRQPITGLPEGDDGSPGECYCGTCSLETVTDVAESLLPVRQRRKVLLIIGTNMSITSSGICGGVLSAHRERAMRALQVANVTVHAFDPTGLQTLIPSASVSTATPAAGARSAAMAAMIRRGNVAILPDHTGGRVLRDPFSAVDHVAAVLRESASYYVLGFVPAAPPTSKRFHRIDVKVNRDDITVQARRGYYGAAAEARLSGERKTVRQLPAMLRTAVEGLWPKTGVALSVTAAPLARPRLDGATVATVVAVEQVFEAAPSLLVAPVSTSVNVLVGAFDRRGEATGTVRQTLALTPQRTLTDSVAYEVVSHLELRPGRYEVRAAVEDARLGRSGSVYTYVDVPDFRQAALGMSGALVEATPARASAPPAALSELVSFVPTARRAFAGTDKVTAFVRIYQGLGRAVTPGYVVAQIVNDRDVPVFSRESRILPEQFGAGRALDHYVELPLERLAAGEYLLTIQARAGTETARRDVRFRVLP